MHRVLGPGLLESAYEHCLVHELALRRIPVERQLALPVIYKDAQLDVGYRLDIVVACAIVVEVKSVERLTAIHQAQLLTYLKLPGHRVGFLMNFNVRLLKDGLQRFVL